MARAVAVLCGGQSRRMGQPKAWLDMGGQPLLARTICRVAPIADVVLVVAGPGQALPPFSEAVETRVVFDRIAHQGPLSGLMTAWDALETSDVDELALVPTDAPFLAPSVLRFLFEARGDHDAVVPKVGGYNQPVCAVYGRRTGELVRKLVAEGRLRPFFLLEQCDVRWVDEAVLLADADIRRTDPELRSFENVNTPEDLERARARLGLR